MSASTQVTVRPAQEIVLPTGGHGHKEWTARSSPAQAAVIPFRYTF